MTKYYHIDEPRKGEYQLKGLDNYGIIDKI